MQEQLDSWRSSLLPGLPCCLSPRCRLELCKLRPPDPRPPAPFCQGEVLKGLDQEREIGAAFLFSSFCQEHPSSTRWRLQPPPSLLSAPASPAPSRHQHAGAELQPVLTLPCGDRITKDAAKYWIKSDVLSWFFKT